MKRILIVALLFFTSPCLANDNQTLNKDEAINELTQTMGLQKILDSTMKQTEASAAKMLSDIGDQVTSQLPNISEEQEEIFHKILNEYAASILESIDVEAATKIYITVIANDMSAEEIQHTLEYYKSPEGAKAKNTIEKASNELNTYLLTQMEQSTKVAYEKLMKDLGLFMKEVREQK
jgi:hypothetical protein